MNTRTRSLIVTSVLVLPCLAVAQEVETFDFNAHLSGAQEVTPPDQPATPSLGVPTEANGEVLVRFSQDLSSFDFRLVVNNGTGVTQAHLHCARPGQNGPIIVPIAEPNEQGQDVNGVLGEGTRGNENIEASAAECEELIGRPVRNIASLAAAAFDGLIYANVHTITNPAGEIRGQLILDDGDDTADDAPPQ